MDRGNWEAIVHGLCKKLDMVEQLTLSLFTYTLLPESSGH